MRVTKGNVNIVKTPDIVKKIKRAGRYEEIIHILNTIEEIKDTVLPVNCYTGEDEKACFYISVNQLKADARKLLIILSPETSFVELYENEDSFETIWRYLQSKNDIFLHNYANSISHRHTPEYDIEEIRASLVLEDLALSLWDEIDTWDIPDGWRKHLIPHRSGKYPWSMGDCKPDNWKNRTEIPGIVMTALAIMTDLNRSVPIVEKITLYDGTIKQLIIDKLAESGISAKEEDIQLDVMCKGVGPVTDGYYCSGATVKNCKKEE